MIFSNILKNTRQLHKLVIVYDRYLKHLGNRSFISILSPFSCFSCQEDNIWYQLWLKYFFQLILPLTKGIKDFTKDFANKINKHVLHSVYSLLFILLFTLFYCINFMNKFAVFLLIKFCLNIY